MPEAYISYPFDFKVKNKSYDDFGYFIKRHLLKGWSN